MTDFSGQTSRRVFAERLLREVRAVVAAGAVGSLATSITALPSASAVVATDRFPLVTSAGIGYKASASILRDYILGITGGTATIPEALTVTGTLTANGSTVLGDAASDTLTVTARMASALEWATDNSLDIGASGANRPRRGYFGTELLAPTGTFTNVAGTLTTASQPNVTTMANLTTIGTLVAGAVPASLVTAGTLGAGAYIITGTSSEPLRLTRTGSGSNVTLRMVNDDGELFFGMNANEHFAVAATNALTNSPWLTVSSTTVTAPASVTTPLVTNAGTLALEATGANVITFSTNGSEAGRVLSGGRFLLGTTTQATGTVILDVVGILNFVGANTVTDATNKLFRMGVRHYTNSEEVAAVIYANSQAAANEVNIGGGVSTMNAATLIRFWTAANNTTVTGTLAGQITSAGLLSWVGNATIGGTLGVTGATTLSSTLTQNGTTASLVQSASTSSLNVGSGSGSSTTLLAIQRAAGQVGDLRFNTGTTLRWIWRVNSVAESGSDAGSAMTLLAFTDAGASIDTTLAITRAAGGTIAFSSARPITGGTYNGQTVSSAASFTGTGTFATGLTVTNGNLLVNRNINESGPLPTGSSVLALRNLDSTAATLHQMMIAASFADTGGTTRVGPALIYYKEQEWTATASTRDAGISWYNIVNGNFARFMNVASTLAVTFDGSGTFATGLTVSVGGVTVTGNSTITGTLGGITTLTATTLAGTLSTAAQGNVTSLGTLTALQVDNLNLNGNTLSSTSGALNITPLAGQAIVLDGTISVDAGVVTGVTNLTASGTVAAAFIQLGALTFIDESASGNLVNTDAGYSVSDTQVVGAQGAAVADATGAGDVVAQLNTLLSRVRAHGLIAT